MADDLITPNVGTVPADAIPITEIAELGPVAQVNHVAYVPWAYLSHVPGCGTGNLAYVPSFLLSAPEYFAGNATKRRDNSIMIALHAQMITGMPQRLEGIGGLVAGQTILQPLLGVENVNDMGTGAYINS